MPRPLMPHLPRAPWAWALTGALIGLLAVLLWRAPAQWLSAAVAQASQGRVQLFQPRGSVWLGSAQLALAGGLGSRDAALLPGRLNWRLHLSGWTLQADLLADCCMQQPWRLSVVPGWGSLRLGLADGQSVWPAAVLAGLGTPWNTVQPQGQLGLSTAGLALTWSSGRLGVEGSARLDAGQMASRLSTLKPMGSYRLSLQGGPTPGFTLETLEGALQLSGAGQWVGGRLRFEGVATATPERLDALANLLNILGQRDGARSIIKVG
ncbi:MAG: type II secretion system protein N [Betaproteobacteria bacterium]